MIQIKEKILKVKHVKTYNSLKQSQITQNMVR